jgi:hypothetical protein
MESTKRVSLDEADVLTSAGATIACTGSIKQASTKNNIHSNARFIIFAVLVLFSFI